MFEGRPGWNTVIVRSDKGSELIDQARRQGVIETENLPEENMQHLSRAGIHKKDRALRTLMRRDLINNQGEERAAVRIPQNVVAKILNKRANCA
jgi:coenzyme F420 hydrogenase subunit beta